MKEEEKHNEIPRKQKNLEISMMNIANCRKKLHGKPKIIAKWHPV